MSLNKYNPVTGLLDPIAGGFNEVGIVKNVDYLINNGVKNSLPFPYYQSNITNNGITFEAKEYGHVHASGTSTGQASIALYNHTQNPLLEAGKRYRLSGCPEGGSEGTYCLYIHFRNGDNTAWTTAYIDSGSGVEFTADGNHYAIFARERPGVTGDRVFSPMIEALDEIGTADHTRVPYANNNAELTSGKIGYENTGNAGVENFLLLDSFGAAVDGITTAVTRDSNGRVQKITIDGTAEENDNIYLSSRGAANAVRLNRGRYVFDVGAEMPDKAYLHLSYTATDGSTNVFVATTQDGKDKVSFTVPEPNRPWNVIIGIKTGAVFDNLDIRPMIYPEGSNPKEYVAAAMTNRELTENVATLNMSGRVDITVTPGTSIKYTPPANGYLHANVGRVSGGKSRVNIWDDADTTYNNQIILNEGDEPQSILVPVRKGRRYGIYIGSGEGITVGVNEVHFFPFGL